LAHKLTVRRTAEEFTGFEAKFDGCCVVMEPLTKNTYVLVVSSDPRVGASFSLLHRPELTLAETAMIQHNIYHAQVHMGEFSTKNVLDRKCG
jgi:Ras-related GTP-binding protein A/B